MLNDFKLRNLYVISDSVISLLDGVGEIQLSNQTNVLGLILVPTLAIF